MIRVNEDLGFHDSDLKGRIIYRLDKSNDVVRFCQGLVNKYKFFSTSAIIIGEDLMDNLMDYCSVNKYNDAKDAVPGYIHDVIGLKDSIPMILIINSDYALDILDEFIKYSSQHRMEVVIVDNQDNKEVLCYHNYTSISYIKLLDDEYYLILDETLINVRDDYDHLLFITEDDEPNYELLVKELTECLYLWHRYDRNTERPDLPKDSEEFLELSNNNKLELENRINLTIDAIRDLWKQK